MLDADSGVRKVQAGDRKEGATRQAGDADSRGGEKAGRRLQQQNRQGASRGLKGGGDKTGRGPKGVGEANERRGRRGRQATDLTLT